MAKKSTSIKFEVKNMMGEVETGSFVLGWDFNADLVDNFDRTVRHIEMHTRYCVREILEFEAITS